MSRRFMPVVPEYRPPPGETPEPARTLKAAGWQYRGRGDCICGNPNEGMWSRNDGDWPSEWACTTCALREVHNARTVAKDD
jgi:hypothetical protein